MSLSLRVFIFFFFNDTATTEIYTLSLHDALPISADSFSVGVPISAGISPRARAESPSRSEEHTSELQSQSNLVCRLLLEKKKKQPISHTSTLRLLADSAQPFPRRALVA